MSTLSTFYAPEHIGNRFGIKGPMYGPKGHLGVDFNKMPAGTSIPAWAAGTVVKRGTSKTLGNYLIVHAAIGYTGYHHMQGVAFVPVGATVKVGTIVGRLGATGTLATGVHLHTTLADSSVVGGQDVHDPLPHILGTVTASTSSSPLGDGTAPKNPTRRKTMSTIYYMTNNDKPQSEGGTITAFALAGDGLGEAAWLPMNAAVYNEMTPIHGGGVFLGKVSFADFEKKYKNGSTAALAAAIAAALNKP